MKHVKRSLILTILSVLSSGIMAQDILWDVDLTGFFDNREYKYPGQTSQTFFGTRLSPEIGIGVLNNKHRIMVGGSWIQPMGAKKDEGSLDLTAYYHYESPKFKMSFGSFARTQLIETLPAFLQYDSLTIFRPNITGALFQYIGHKGYGEIYIDWRQMQTEKRREAFIIVGSGRWQPGIFYAGGNIVMNHLARSKNATEGQSVTDDMVVHPYVGLNLTRFVSPLDSLTIQCGYLLSLERNRGIGTWHHPQSITAEMLAEWRFIGLKNTFYAGGNQQPFYPQLGSQLNQGDPFYQAKLYNRTDIYFYFFRNRFVNCMASVNFHTTRSHVDLQQQLIVRFNLNNESWKKRNEPSGKNRLKNIL